MYFYYIIGLVWIHEMGHAIVVCIYSKCHGLKFPTHIVLNIYPCKGSNGKTLTDAYKTIEGHKLATQLNSIAGVLAELICTLLISYAIFISALPQCYAAAIIVPFSLSFINTICKGKHNTNNDIYIFKHPEQFKYNPDA